ncbi:hypothetical protein C8Q80DRAFT_1115863 [Daedaleopsis nitida]|nr:hypothetical protein C8Q80DRAFT_1115863 [Daedaleopsis nitida]
MAVALRRCDPRAPSACRPDAGDQQLLPAFFQHLPRLRELTVYNGLSAMYRSPVAGHSVDHVDDTLGCANALRMPALERLHLGACGSTRTAFLRRSPLRDVHLTHLRISNIGHGDSYTGFADLLTKALGLPLPGWRHAWGFLCGTNSAEYQGVRWSLEEVVATLNLMEGVRALFLRSEEGVFVGCSPERLWDDWLDRIDGGRGCWVESQEEEERLESVVTVRQEHEELRQLQELQLQLEIADEDLIAASRCVCEDSAEQSDEGDSTSIESSWGCNIV